MIVFGSTNHNFYAVDKDGRQIWRYPTFDRIKGDPIIVGNNVIFGSYDDHIYALDLITSETRWTYPSKEPAAAPAAAEGNAAAPLLPRKALRPSLRHRLRSRPLRRRKALHIPDLW